jgi:putative peptidoglycan lipid II flippase
MQLPLGLFGVAFAAATLPAISRSVAAQRLAEFRDTVAHSLSMIFALTIPASVGIAVLGPSMIATVFEGGSFSAHDTRQTAAALTCYCVGLAGYSAIKVLAPAFYALSDARTPMLVSIASIGTNLCAAHALLRWTALGHAALALSTSVVAVAGAALLFALLRKRSGGLHGRRLALSSVKISLAALVMGAACRASSLAVHAFLHGAKTAAAADVAISIPIGAAVFYATARILRIREVEAMWDACYTAVRNAPRSEVGDSAARN